MLTGRSINMVASAAQSQSGGAEASEGIENKTLKVSEQPMNDPGDQPTDPATSARLTAARPARAPLPAAAQRALREAEERRRLADQRAAANPPAKEIGGRAGPDPTRYGDWEKNGIASDF
jgi:hypothetical protein